MFFIHLLSIVNIAIMDTMMHSFGELSRLMQIFWACAVAGSLVTAIQMLLTIFGGGDVDGDVDAVSVDGLDASTMADLFTLKNFVNFFVGFGWAGVTFRQYIDSDAWLLVVAALFGLLFIAMFLFLYKKLMKLESNSAVGASACVGKSADVYLRIPAARSGKGKIQISLNGVPREFDAITDSSETIPSGAVVVVDEVVNGTVLLVSRR